MRILLAFLITFFLATPLFSQTETTTWNGKTYFIYPYQDESFSKNLFIYNLFAEQKEVLKRDEKNRKVVSKTVVPIENTGERKEIFKDKKMKKMRALLEESLENDGEGFLNTENALENELIPATEPLPDGEYIQYYRDIPYLDKKVLRFKNEIVAGVFTLKNGVPEGEAKFYDPKGRLIKKGAYTNGSRNGMWETYSFPVRIREESDIESITTYKQLMEAQVIDTAVEQQMYADALKNGAYTKFYNKEIVITGTYKDNKQAGSWVEKDFRTKNEAGGTERSTLELITIRKYTFAENPPAAKSMMLRSEAATEIARYRSEMYGEYGEEEEKDTTFTFPEYSTLLYLDFQEFYDIAWGKTEEGIDLPQEEMTSYEGEEYGGDDFSYYRGQFHFDNKSYSRQQIIDSLGYKYKYTGLLEEYHRNGQLKYSFEITDGKLVAETPVYWENGVVANEVVFVPDSNHYEVRYYDYKGKLYETEVFDEKGNPKETEPDYDYNPYGLSTEIGRLEYNYAQTNDVFVYKNDDGIPAGLSETIVLEQKLWKKDTSMCLQKTYNPKSRTLETTISAISKKPAFHQLASFNEEFNTINATEDYSLGNLRTHVQINGSRDESRISWMEDDTTISAAQKYVPNWAYRFDTESDAVFYRNDQPYSGKYTINFNKRRYSLSQKDGEISFNLPDNEFKQIWSSRYKYWKRGKLSPILDAVTPQVFPDYTYSAVHDLTPFIGSSVYTGINRYDEYAYPEFESEREYMEFEESIGKKDKFIPVQTTTTGSFLNGKPHGLWVVNDQSGKSMVEVTFDNGVENGKKLIYRTLPAPSKAQLKRRKAPGYRRDPFAEPTPDVATRYLERSVSIKNGIRNGSSLSFNWKGDTLSHTFYVDGYQQGPAFERNTFVYSSMNYEYGSLDGIMRTWLTLPGKDSLLLFDLGFQNGALQGESKAYHANGKLAKHGFFLTGEPIDDYEAYDTNGLKYQYVRFQYGQPVEEKIWEENQLSVKYTFDWRDSIPFNARDIAESPSIDRMLVELGLQSDEYYYQPYYGRPSLVDKSGIDYYMTKYYPNDTMAREGYISSGKKTACWNYYDYSGKKLYEVDYTDTNIVINDSIKFRSKGVLSYVDASGNATSHAYIIEKFEKYDCSHTDHYEERMLYTYWEKDTATHRINGYVKNYYDNGSLMNEGQVANGLPTGIWKLYSSNGTLSHVGEYVSGKRNGRWLSGDLTNVKFLGDICLNPNLPNLEEIMSYQEKLLDITVTYYKTGEVKKTEYYGINMNNEEAPDGFGENEYEEGF